MAEIHGKGGSLTYSTGGSVIATSIKSWVLTYNCDAPEVTDFADAGVKSFIVGCTSWTATAEGNWDVANVGKPGDAAAALALQVTSALGYSGSAIITGMTPTVSADGVASVSYTFQGTGALTIDVAP